MSSRAHFLRIGIFIVTAVAGAIAIALFLGAGGLFKHRIMLETYFNESVHGLTAGSKIQYRGVTVGEVTGIGFSYAQYEQDKPPTSRKQYVMVEGTIDPLLVFGQDEPPTDERLRYWIGNGLRFRLNPQGITGTSYLELDFFPPNANPLLNIGWPPRYLYIPTATSALSRLMSSTEEFMRKLDRVDLPKLLENMNTLLLNLNSQVAKVKTGELNKKALTTLDELQTAASRVKQLVGADDLKSVPADLGASSARLRRILEDTDLKPSIARLDGVLQQVDGIMKQLDGSAKRLDGVLVQTDRIVSGKESEVADTLDNLRQISDNLRSLSEEARKYPAGLVLGDPPRPSSVVQPDKGRK